MAALTEVVIVAGLAFIDHWFDGKESADSTGEQQNREEE